MIFYYRGSFDKKRGRPKAILSTLKLGYPHSESEIMKDLVENVSQFDKASKTFCEWEDMMDRHRNQMVTATQPQIWIPLAGQPDNLQITIQGQIERRKDYYC